MAHHTIIVEEVSDRAGFHRRLYGLIDVSADGANWYWTLVGEQPLKPEGPFTSEEKALEDAERALGGYRESRL